MAGHQPPEEDEHEPPPRPELTPVQEKHVVIKKNRINPSLGEKMTISVTLENSEHLSIRIYNSSGEHLQTVTNQDWPEGIHEFTWDGSNAQGHILASGIYFISIDTPTFHTREKGLILK